MIREKLKQKGMVVDCSGPNGNAFYLLGLAQDLAKRCDYTQNEIDKMMTELKSSDYEHLIKVFDKHFGSIVDLVYRG